MTGRGEASGTVVVVGASSMSASTAATSHDSDDDDDVGAGQLWGHHHHRQQVEQQVGYLGLDGAFGSALSPQPSSSGECENRVSPQDPNLSSAARYSPPPPYTSPIGGLGATLDHPDSPMEDLSHSSLPILPAGVSSSSPTVHTHNNNNNNNPMPHSSLTRPSTSRVNAFVSTNSLFAPQSLPRAHAHRWPSPVLSDDDDDDDNVSVGVTQPVTHTNNSVLVESVWAKQKRLVALKSLVMSDGVQPGPSGLQTTSTTTASLQSLPNKHSRPHSIMSQPSSTQILSQSGSPLLHNQNHHLSLPQPVSLPNVVASRTSHTHTRTRTHSSQPSSSGSQSSSSVTFRGSAQSGPSCSSVSEGVSHSGSHTTTVSHSMEALSSSGGVMRTLHHSHPHSSDSDDGGSEDGSSGCVDISPRLCSTPARASAAATATIRGCLVLPAGEAEAMNGIGISGSSGIIGTGCEAAASSSSINSHVVSPLHSPSTPADNCVVSSSTGHIDSVPPTPAEFQGNDVSDPSSPASPSLASVAILDSTVDSTSGRELTHAHVQSSDDESEDNIHSGRGLQLPSMNEDADEISTSEVALQHSDDDDSEDDVDDSEDVALLVNPQGVFSTGRSSTTRLIEQLSLSLSHFSSNSNNTLDASLSAAAVVDSEQQCPTSPLSHRHNDGPYLDDPLATPGPSRLSLPMKTDSTNTNNNDNKNQRDQSSISSTHGTHAHNTSSIRTTVQVLDNTLPLLDITTDLPTCSNSSSTTHTEGQQHEQGNRGRPSDVRRRVASLECTQTITNPNTDSSSNASITVNTGSRVLNQLSKSYVLELNEENSNTSDNDDLSSEKHGELDDGTLNGTLSHETFEQLTSDHDSLLDSAALGGSALNTSLSLTLAAAEPEGDITLPSPSSQPSSLTHHLLPSQPDQVSLLVGDGGEDSSDGALLMMVTSDSPSVHHNTITLDKATDSNTVTAATNSKLKSDDFEEKDMNPQSSLQETNTHMHKCKRGEEEEDEEEGEEEEEGVGREVEAAFIGADYWCGECGQVYTHQCPQHSQQHLRDEERETQQQQQQIRTRAYHLAIPKVMDTEGIGEEGSNGFSQSSPPPHHIQAISDKPVKSRAWASLPAQHLVIRKAHGSQELGVFTRKAIPKQTQFGPLEGVVMSGSDGVTSPCGLTYSIVTQHNDKLHLDTSDEGSSNWMRFVRRAFTYIEQNCVVVQVDGNLYFLTSVDIPPRMELRVGYSKQYANKRDLDVLTPTEEEMKLLESVRKCWPCYECGEGFETSPQLQQHLATHDQEVCEEERRKRKRVKGRRTRTNGECETTASTTATATTTTTKKLNKRIKILEEVQDTDTATQQEEEGSVDIGENASGSIPTNQCVVCSLTFTMPEVLRIHQRSHPNVEVKQEDIITFKEEDNTCPQCSKVLESEIELYNHVEEHGFYLQNSSNKPYKCDYCYKSFLRQERLAAHLVVHGNEAEKEFHCKVCLRRFCSNSALTTHYKHHIGGSKGYDCPICRQGFFSVANLKAHVTTHCIDQQYKCPTCLKVFPTYSKIRRHIRSYHAILPHTCTKCGKKMPSADKLKIHMLSHSDQRDFLCQDCGKRFKRKDKLREHCQRMHSTQRQTRQPRANPRAPPKFVPKVDPNDYQQFVYKCHTCLLGFKRRGMLVNHLAKRHPNVDRNTVPELNQPIVKATRCYYCQYCDKMYRSSSKRKLHILKYHPGAEVPPGPSTQCDNEWGEGGSFSQTVGATKVDPHSCQWCHRQYASRARLLRHQRHNHRDFIDSTHLKEYDLSSDLPGDLAGEGSDPLLVNLGHAQGPVSTSDDDLLTQAMGEISPLPNITTNSEQYVRLLSTDSSNSVSRQLLVSNDSSSVSRQLLVSGDSGISNSVSRQLLVSSDSSSLSNSVSRPLIVTNDNGNSASRQLLVSSDSRLVSSDNNSSSSHSGSRPLIVTNDGSSSSNSISRSLLVSDRSSGIGSDSSSSSNPTTTTTLALVTTDSPETVTLSLPTGQFISLIPGLSVASSGNRIVTSNQSTSNNTHATISLASMDSLGSNDTTQRTSMNSLVGNNAIQTDSMNSLGGNDTNQTQTTTNNNNNNNNNNNKDDSIENVVWQQTTLSFTTATST